MSGEAPDDEPAGPGEETGGPDDGGERRGRGSDESDGRASRGDEGESPETGANENVRPGNEVRGARDPPAVAVVGAETPGNVGTVARAMKNFGFSELLLVDPPSLPRDGEAYGFAGAAREDVLPSARELGFDELVAEYHTVGFTAITNESGARHVRYPFDTPGELAGQLADDATGDVPVALVFGRERVGLTNEELARLDRICSIPANPDYPTLNLGQAATVALYELRGLALGDGDDTTRSRATQHPDRDRDRATPAEVEGFHEHFSDFLGELRYPEEKRAKTERLMRRLVGRANPTGRELRTLRGIFRRAVRSAERREE